MDSNLSAGERSRLLAAAQDAIKQAYAPYSKFRVGAAVLTQRDALFSGCNVESASYGLTICAERVAIFSAITQEGADNMKIRALAVVCESGGPCSPCGACRQVILEFGQDAIILFRGDVGLEERRAIDLLPEGFRLL